MHNIAPMTEDQQSIKDAVAAVCAQFDAEYWRKTDDIDRARHLLQDKTATYIPGRLADAIIDANQLDPAVRESLRLRIRDADADPRAIEAIRRDFGITIGSPGV